MYTFIPFLLTMKKKTTVLMAAVLAAVISLATGLAVLPTSVQDAQAQAQSCVTNGESVIDGGGSTSSESATIEIEQGDIETCASGTLVTAQSDKGGQTTLNEEEDEYEYDFEYEYEYEYE
jgi:hypothetical protein